MLLNVTVDLCGLVIDGGESRGLAEQESVNIRRDNVEVLLQ
jgi:hypothetical protein